MEELSPKKNIYYFIGLASGILAAIFCVVSLGLSVVNNYVAIYILSLALFFLGINRIGLHLSNFKKNIFIHLFATGFIFVLAVFVALTKYGIYFLITSMFLYSVMVIVDRMLKIKEDRSTQSIIFNVLCSVFIFLYSFVFFFPVIFEKHATSVSNSNFIVMCFAIAILVSSGKNLLFPYHKTLKLHLIGNIIKKTMVYEIILSLLILIILCSLYFTIVEPAMTSYVDALWYSFSVITTIGFGDVYVTTTFGRILSVILGISGIVVVALFTSVIVNMYNELNRRREDKKTQELQKQIDEIEKVQEEMKASEERHQEPEK